jgi:predicted ABC-type ATPase
MGTLLVITGPPGAGKSTVALVMANAAEPSVLVEGDVFFGFLMRGAIEPWLPESNEQNEVVTRAAASAAGRFAAGGFRVIYDGVVGPWFLPTFAAATGLCGLEYVVLLPPVEICVARVQARRCHGFSDEAATRKMHAEFTATEIPARHVVHQAGEDAATVAESITAALERGDLTYALVR